MDLDETKDLDERFIPFQDAFVALGENFVLYDHAPNDLNKQFEG